MADQVFLGQIELDDKIVRSEFQNSKVFKNINITTMPVNSSIKFDNGWFYHCKNIFEPKINDSRLQFQAAGRRGDTVSMKNLRISQNNF